MSPRRSSRARSSQQPPAPSQANSSSSSTTTLKDTRNTRVGAANRSASPRRASAQRSESVDDADTMSRSDQTAPRRSRRGVEVEKEPLIKQQSVEQEENEVIEDDVTRCICGQAEYPGPSANIPEQYNTTNLPDDIGNFFVQCDNCHVWQHGGCMGLFDEAIIPDEYYCEKCRPDLHRVTKGANLSKISRYLPVLEGSSRSTPLSTVDQPRLKDVKNKILQNTTRRATMNSRGAYDEDEMLRRAIEESKAQDSLGKRTREDSEDLRPNNKRQRTGSSQSDTFSKKSLSPDPTGKSSTGKSGSKLRGAAARNNREKEMRDKQKQEAAAQRAEAANKRNARSERRRADESPPPTPTISPAKAVQAMSQARKGKADTPQPGKGPSSRKNGGRLGARGKKVGRNQYTRDYYDTGDTPHRDTSHDRNGVNSPHGINGESGRSSKARTHPARTSLNEMKKRVAAILEFVSSMQTQDTNSSKDKTMSTNSNGSNSRSSNNSGKGSSTPNGTQQVQIAGIPTSSLVQAVTAGLESMDGDSGDNSSNNSGKMSMLKFVDEADFAKMGSGQMMETLAKELVGWQSHFGIYSR